MCEVMLGFHGVGTLGRVLVWVDTLKPKTAGNLKEIKKVGLRNG